MMENQKYAKEETHKYEPTEEDRLQTYPADTNEHTIYNGKSEEDNDNYNRPKVSTWGSQLEFMLACIGYSVGLGSIWRFPYLCMQNGGGAFLLPFFISLFLCGMPLYLLELAIAQFSGLRPLHIWNICPLLKGLGFAMGIACSIVSIYYNVVLTWGLYFLFKSFTPVLPWTGCNNWWNTPLCYDAMQTQQTYENLSDISTLYNSTNYYNSVQYNQSDGLINIREFNARKFANISDNTSIPWKSAAEEFWMHEVLEISPGIDDLGGMNWELFGCFILGWTIVFLCLSKGIKSLGKVVYVTATAPYVLLTVLLIRGVTLPGAIDGIKFYLIPEWDKLFEFKVWAEACLQVFYALGPAWGSVITIASYSRFNNNCVRDSIIVPIVTGITSLYGGFILFAIIGYMAHETQRPIQDFVTSGPGLAFIAYPQAIAKLPFSPLWAVLFFLMILTVGLDSQFGTMEFLTSSVIDLLPLRLRKYRLSFTALVCVTEAVLGMIFVTRGGVYIFQIIDWYVATFAVMIIAMTECVILAWIYGHERFYYDIKLMTGVRPNIFWKICWCFITPLLLMMLLIYSLTSMQEPTYGNYVYPRWAIGFGWVVSMVSLIPMPFFFVKAIREQKGSFYERLKESLKPNPIYTPSDENCRELYKYTPQARTLCGFGKRKDL